MSKESFNKILMSVFICSILVLITYQIITQSFIFAYMLESGSYISNYLTRSFYSLQYWFTLLAIISWWLIFYQKNKSKLIQENYLPKNKWIKINYLLYIIIILYLSIYVYSIWRYSFQFDEFYHAIIVKNWFELWKFPYINETYWYYYRWMLVWILWIISDYIFSFLNIGLSKEFIYRFPIILLSWINVYLIFNISRFFLNEKLSLIVSLLYISEIWFFYMWAYFRTYNLWLTLILIILLNLFKNNFNIKSIIIWIITSILWLLLIENWFLFIWAFLWLVLLEKIYKINKKYFYILLISWIIIFIIMVWYIYMSMSNYSQTYNIFKLNLDITFNKNYFIWLVTNYYYILIALIPALIILIKYKDSNSKYLWYFILFHIFIIFGYINFTFYNFTFRFLFYFLPILLIPIVLFFNFVFNNNKILYLLIWLWFLQLFSFFPSWEWSYYHPYKRIYEKQPFIIDNKSSFEIIKQYATDNKLENYEIWNLSLFWYPNIYYWWKNWDYLFRWKWSSIKEISLIWEKHIWDLIEFINVIDNSKNLFIIVYPTTQKQIENPLWELLYWNKNSLEASSKMYEYISEKYEDNLIYISKDWVWKVYFINENLNNDKIE